MIVNTINGEDVNTLYYHWGAYTDSALGIVAMLRDNITEAYDKLPSDMDCIARFTKDLWVDMYDDNAEETWSELEKNPLTFDGLDRVPIENAESYQEEMPDQWYDPNCVWGQEPQIIQKIR